MWAEKSVLIESLLPNRTATAAVGETGDRVKLERLERKVRTQKEQQEYNMILQYVATHKISVYIGIPKVVMARVDRSHIESMFYTVTFKLPTFLALLFAARKYFVN